MCYDWEEFYQVKLGFDMKHHVEFDIELRKNLYKGKYIAIEGIDGGGKTTQVGKIAEYFKSQGESVVLTKEPRKEGLIGDIIQKVLAGELKMPSVALQYLFSTDRVLHHEEVIVPALKAGKTVISDRCFWSAVVYGILDRTGGQYDYNDVDFMLIAHSILSMYNQFIVPDYTFYLKISLPVALERIANKKDALEIYENKEKLRKIIEGYNWLSTKFAKEIIAIDGEGTVSEVTKRIVNKISNF